MDIKSPEVEIIVNEQFKKEERELRDKLYKDLYEGIIKNIEGSEIVTDIEFMDIGRSYVYFLAVKGTEYVKIGFSRSIRMRMADIDVCVPYELNLLFCIRGTEELEYNLHKVFELYRVKGEWFRIEGTLKDLMGSCLNRKSVENDIFSNP